MPFALFALKIILYYVLMGLTKQLPLLVLVTGSYALVGHYLSGKNVKIKLGLSLILSLLMFSTVLYYRYFNAFLSLRTIGQADQLLDVSESIWPLLDIPLFLLFIDLPFLFVKPKEPQDSAKRKTLPLILAISIIVCAGFNPLQIRLFKGISHTELITYHILDFMPQTSDIAFSSEALVERDIQRDEFWSLAKGKNVIVLQVEALQDMVIHATYHDQIITPNLNALISNDSIYFSNYYQQLGKGNTSDAEFVTQNSIHAAMLGPTYTLYEENTFNGLPWLFKDLGYSTSVFHGFKKDFWNRRAAYPKQGFDVFVGEEDLNVSETIGLGITDESFYNQVVPVLDTLEKPFYSFVISLSSHTPFTLPDTYKKLILKEEDEGTFFGNYLQAVHYADQAIGSFIEALKSAHLYENTLIVLYGDHFGISTKQEEEVAQVSQWLGQPYDFQHMMNIPLVFHLPGFGQTVENKRAGGQFDFAPTLLHLMGFEKLPKNLLGQDLFSAAEGFVATQTYMLEGSFITDNVVFEMSRDGVFENSRVYDIHTLERLNPKGFKDLYQKALDEIRMSHYLLETNAFSDQKKADEP